MFERRFGSALISLMAKPHLPFLTTTWPQAKAGANKGNNARPLNALGWRRRASVVAAVERRAGVAVRATAAQEDEKALSPIVEGLDKAPLHVHVGAGKLAMGLLLPALSQSQVPFIVVRAVQVHISFTPC